MNQKTKKPAYCTHCGKKLTTEEAQAYNIFTGKKKQVLVCPDYEASQVTESSTELEWTNWLLKEKYSLFNLFQPKPEPKIVYNRHVRFVEGRDY